MSSVRKFSVILAALGMLMFLAGPALAGQLDGTGHVEGDATGSASSETGEINNDEHDPPNPNSMTANIIVNGWGPINKVFGYGGNTGGVTEYFMTENITNGMNFTITDFHLDLAWRIGGVGDQPSVALDGLDFDWAAGVPSNTPPPSSSALLNCVNNVSEDNLDYYSTGLMDVVLPGGMFQLTYSVDVPDAPAGTTHLVIRQWATPEPGTFVLLAIAGISALLFVWRKRRIA